jgi:hypothetical protein
VIFLIVIVSNALLLLELANANVVVYFVRALNIGDFVEKIEKKWRKYAGFAGIDVLDVIYRRIAI